MVTTIKQLIEDKENSCVKDIELYRNRSYSTLSEIVTAKAAAGSDIGCGYLMLGKCELGREWLEAVAGNCLLGFEQNSEYTLNAGAEFDRYSWDKLEEPLTVAILSRSDETLEDIVSKARATIDDIPEDATVDRATVREYKYKALMSVALDEADRDTAVARFREQVEDESAGHDPKFDRPVATALTGLVRQDVSLVTEGVHQQLQIHEEYTVEQKPRREMKWRMDWMAATLVELAGRRDLHVDVDSEHLPPCVFPEKTESLEDNSA